MAETYLESEAREKSELRARIVALEASLVSAKVVVSGLSDLLCKEGAALAEAQGLLRTCRMAFINGTTDGNVSIVAMLDAALEAKGENRG